MMNLVNLFESAKNAETYAAGHVIFQEGQPGNVMYVMIEGEVDLVYQNTVLETIGPGAIMGEMALLESQSQYIRTATARAKTACKLVPVDQKRFTFLVHETPNFALHVMTVMAERLRKRTIAKIMLALQPDVPGAGGSSPA
jgi:CRP-like cAMP-binding protein